MGITERFLDRWLIVVPARLESQRLRHKPLQDLGGKPLIVRVVQNLAPLAHQGATLVVATDADEVAEICTKYQITAVLTAKSHQSGTDRCFEVAGSHKHELVLNVQGDEPFLANQDLLALTSLMESKSEIDIGTLTYQSSDRDDFQSPNVVKAVRAANGFALYFSRAPIPYTSNTVSPFQFWHHIGVYAFRRPTLSKFCGLSPSPLEQRERLEQLRALEAGFKIYLQPASQKTIGIDTPEDLEAARARY